MRWVSYVSDRGIRTGLVDDTRVLALAPGETLLDLLNAADGLTLAAERANAEPSEVVELDQVRLVEPLRPGSLRDSLGFLQHARNAGITNDQDFERVPATYFANVGSVTGPYDDVAIFPGSRYFDYELEIAAVIGKRGADIPLAAAEDHIAGYLLYCDWSARDLQMPEMRMLGPFKGKDGANSLGPMLVTPDELEPFRRGTAFDLCMTAYVNNELVSEGNWSSTDWGFADMIVYASRGATLYPGDAIGSGTVTGGCLAEHFVTDPDNFRGWLNPGDEVRLVVEQLGEQRHRILAAGEPEPLSTEL